MKKYIIYPIVMMAFIVNSCSNFLEEDPKGQVAADAYYKTEEDAVSAVNSVYGYLGSYNVVFGGPGVYHGNLWVTQGLASDEMNNNQQGAADYDQLGTFSFNSENGAILQIWQIHYKTIYLANIAIERIPLINMDDSLKNRLVNEAKFLRALLYFNLVRMYGSVPLLTSEEVPMNPEVSPVAEIYNQIINDLENAESLPETGNIQNGRANKEAAKALLSKVYLRLGDFEQSATLAKEVIDSNKYGLWDNYADAFKFSGRGGKEAIFSVGNGDGGGRLSFWEFGQMNVRLLPKALSREVDGVINTQGWQVATQDLYDSFSPEDERRDATFITEFINRDGKNIKLDQVYIDKYWDRQAEPNAGDTSNDFPVIRYSDILLTYAEAEAEQGDFAAANKYLNLVRNRANLNDVNIMDTESLKQEILVQRRKEFVAEGMRWFDLTRMGKLKEKVQEAKGIDVDPRYLLFPLPQRERDVNSNLPQNKGY